MTTKEKVIKFLSIGNQVMIVGSFNKKTLRYKNDIDLNEKVKTSPNDFLNIIKSKYKEVLNNPFIWIIDFKLGTDDRGQGIHWSSKDIENGYKIIRHKKYKFTDLFNQKSIIKMDVTAYINGRFYDFSNNYFLTLPNGETTDEFVGNIITRLLLDYYNLIDQGNFFKALKRLHSIYAIDRSIPKVKEIEAFLNSSVGKLNRQLSNLKTLSLLIENKFSGKPIPIEYIISNLKSIKSKLPDKYHQTINMILHQQNLTQMNNKINELVRMISKDVNIDTFGFIMTINNILK
jgi:hypothetical protein